MAHIDSLSAAKYTSLDYIVTPAVRPARGGASGTAEGEENTFGGEFTTGVTFGVEQGLKPGVVHVGNIREFPSLGTPANVVNVPVYGQSTSSQVAGQSDAPSLDFTINYIPAVHAPLDDLRKAGTSCIFRVRISDEAATVGEGGAASLVDDAEVKFSDFFFIGTVASFEVTPGLTDSLQASFTLTIDGDFVGPGSTDVLLDFYTAP